MKAGSFRALPKAVTPENAPVSDRNGNFQEFLRTFEIASRYSDFKIAHSNCFVNIKTKESDSKNAKIW